MKIDILFITFISIVILSSCNPKVSSSISKTYQADPRQKIALYGITDNLPENTEILGEVKVGDTGFTTNCSFEVVVAKAQYEARMAGGNAIKIVRHRSPKTYGSGCHRITAKILKVQDLEINISEEEIADVDYATIHIYRYGGMGSIIGFDLYLDEEKVCRVKNSFKTTLHVKQEGFARLWAQTEAKSEVPFHIEKGKSYYLRCKMTLGVFVARPNLELVPAETGKLEFQSFNAKN